MKLSIENHSKFEEDKRLFIKYWNAPIFSEEWREQVKIVYLIPTYGCDDPNIIFGECA